MDIVIQWLPTIITILIWTVIFWGRNWLAAKIKASIEHDFNLKLESLKSELRSKENEISTLRDSVLTGRNQRQALVEKRRVEAVENIWKGVVELQRFKAVAGAMAAINMDYAAEEAPRDPKVRKFFEVISNLGPKIENMPQNSAANERPFISPVAWAYFSALQIILTGLFARAKILELGVADVGKLLNTEYEKKLLTTALPHQKAYIDKHDVTAYYYLIDELEEKLLVELANILAGKASDEANIKRAAEIQKEIDKMNAEKYAQSVA